MIALEYGVTKSDMKIWHLFSYNAVISVIGLYISVPILFNLKDFG